MAQYPERTLWKRYIGDHVVSFKTRHGHSVPFVVEHISKKKLHNRMHMNRMDTAMKEFKRLVESLEKE